ncbi:hypothetical protein ACA910_006081 [Epithemia clementina (nom. ined.)]
MTRPPHPSSPSFRQPQQKGSTWSPPSSGEKENHRHHVWNQPLGGGSPSSGQSASSPFVVKSPDAVSRRASATGVTNDNHHNNHHDDKNHDVHEAMLADEADHASSSSAMVELTTTTTGLSQMELDDLRCTFALLDVNGQGRIQLETLYTALEAIQNNHHQRQRRRRRPHPAFQRLDEWKKQHQQESERAAAKQGQEQAPAYTKNHNDSVDSNNSDEYITFDDFVHLLTDADPSDTRSELHKVFDLFDVHGRGYITVDDLARIAHELGEDLSLEELQEMMARAAAATSDDNHYKNGQGGGSGVVTLEQFETIMSKPMFDD